MTRDEFTRAIERLRAQRDPQQVRPSERRRMRDDAAAIRALEQFRKDRTLRPSLAALRDRMMRDRRGDRWIEAAWEGVIRAPALRGRCRARLMRGELRVEVPDHAAGYLLRRELAGGGWVELQRVVPVAMTRYRIIVRGPSVQMGSPPTTQDEPWSSHSKRDSVGGMEDNPVDR